VGRHFERKDAGYSCYSGFLHMEAMHTNPIIICFCSILYYKDLSEHLLRYKKQRKALMGEIDGGAFMHLNKFTGRLSFGDTSIAEENSKRQLVMRVYDKRVIMRWHLYLRMTLNKEIIKYRKWNFIKKTKKPKEGIFQKIKNRVTGICHRNAKESTA
jgi:hypothetical protein